MKKATLSLVLLFVSISLYSQNTGKKAAAQAGPTTDEIVFRNALHFNDLATATASLYRMMAANPNRAELKDTLCLLYFGRGLWDQSRLVATEILAQKPDNQEILEALAISEESLGMYAEAITHYENLYKLNHKPYFLYQAASLQYNLKRYGECEGNLKLLIENPDASKESIVITDQARNNQKINLVAAAYNVLGVSKMDVKDFTTAKVCFEKALGISPDFILAKNNLSALTEQGKKGN